MNEDKPTLTRQEHIAVLAKVLTEAIKQIRNLSLEVGAYQLALGAWKFALPQHAQPLNEALAAARRNDGLRERLRQEYDIPLERFLALDAELQTEAEILRLLQKNLNKWVQ
jgi:hypothetical protein